MVASLASKLASHCNIASAIWTGWLLAVAATCCASCDATPGTGLFAKGDMAALGTGIGPGASGLADRDLVCWVGEVDTVARTQGGYRVGCRFVLPDAVSLAEIGAWRRGEAGKVHQGALTRTDQHFFVDVRGRISSEVGRSIRSGDMALWSGFVVDVEAPVAIVAEALPILVKPGRGVVR